MGEGHMLSIAPPPLRGFGGWVAGRCGGIIPRLTPWANR
jgi:hypothetical protein